MLAKLKQLVRARPGGSKQHVYALGALLLLNPIIFAKLVFLRGDGAPYLILQWDFAAQYCPWLIYIGDSFRAGVIPRWVPYVAGGTPFFINPQTQLYSPLTLFIATLFGYSERTAQLQSVLMMFMGGVGAYLLSYALWRNRWSALVTGVCFNFTSAVFTNLEHMTIINSVTLLPWLFWATALAARPLKRWSFPTLAFLVYFFYYQRLSRRDRDGHTLAAALHFISALLQSGAEPHEAAAERTLHLSLAVRLGPLRRALAANRDPSQRVHTRHTAHDGVGVDGRQLIIQTSLGHALFLYADRDSLLVFNEIFFPGWRATVDGQRAAVTPVSGGLRGVQVAAGAHVIVLNFQPSSFYVGVAVSLISAALFLLWCCLISYAARRANKIKREPTTGDDVRQLRAQASGR